MEKVTVMLERGCQFYNIRQFDRKYLRLVPKLPRQGDVLLPRRVLELERAILEEVLDARGQLLVLLYLALELELALQLHRQLLVHLGRGGLSQLRRRERGG